LQRTLVDCTRPVWTHGRSARGGGGLVAGAALATAPTLLFLLLVRIRARGRVGAPGPVICDHRLTLPLHPRHAPGRVKNPGERMRAASVRLELRKGWSCESARPGARHPLSTHTHPVSLHSARCSKSGTGKREGRAGIRAYRAVGAPHNAHTVYAKRSAAVDHAASAAPRPSLLLAEFAGVRVGWLLLDGTDMNCGGMRRPTPPAPSHQPASDHARRLNTFPPTWPAPGVSLSRQLSASSRRATETPDGGRWPLTARPLP
jgi:hypothetical protein